MSFLAARRVRVGFVGVCVLLVASIGATACSSGSDPSATPTTKSTGSTTTSTSTGDTGGSTTSTEFVSHNATIEPPASTTSVAPGGGRSPSTAPGTAPGAPPIEPTGLFLNTNELSLGGGATPSAGRSVCKTSPGATCQVRFTGPGGTHSLPAKPVGKTGSVSWDWTPAGLGLPAGHYDVTVVASRGGHDVTATDARGLTVVN